jgi:hypothetical protein
MARHFTATDDVHWVVTPAPNALGCIAFFIKTTQLTTNTAVVTYWNSISRNGAGVLLNNAANKISGVGESSTGAVVNIASATSINDGNPHHIAFNYNRNSGGSNQLYIDGVQETAANSSAAWTSASAAFWTQAGKNLDPFWAGFVGDLWEIGHWQGGQLNADQIAALAKGFSPKLVKPSSLILYAPLVSDVHDIRNGYASTATGGSQSDQGRVVGGAV